MSLSGEKYFLLSSSLKSCLEFIFVLCFCLLSFAEQWNLLWLYNCVWNVSSAYLGKMTVKFCSYCSVSEGSWRIFFYIIYHLDTWDKSEQPVKHMGFTSLLACSVWNTCVCLCKTQEGKTHLLQERILRAVISKEFSLKKKKKIVRKRPGPTEHLWLQLFLVDLEELWIIRETFLTEYLLILEEKEKTTKKVRT